MGFGELVQYSKFMSVELFVVLPSTFVMVAGCVVIFTISLPLLMCVLFLLVLLGGYTWFCFFFLPQESVLFLKSLIFLLFSF